MIGWLRNTALVGRTKSGAGMSLIELMVALTIGTIVSLAIFSVLANSEGRKRATTSVNDINQSGNYALYVLDKWIRSAGSGFTQSADYMFGCPLYAKKSGTQILPRTSALPAPFASVGGTTKVSTGTANLYRLAPALIVPAGTTPGASGSGSDVLIIMSGVTGMGEVWQQFTAIPTTSDISLDTNLSVANNDILLLGEKQIGASGGLWPCMIQQAASSAASSTSSASSSSSSVAPISLSGTYAAATVGAVNLTDMTVTGRAMSIGNVVGGNPPAFMVLGVGDNNTLFSYDLLETTSTSLLPIADGVFEMHALYGIDTNDDGKVDDWVSPSTTGGYAIATLMDGSASSATLLKRIKAVRVGLILRTATPDKKVASPISINLFADVVDASNASLKFTRTLTATEQLTPYRYRVMESTIPLRNVMMVK